MSSQARSSLPLWNPKGAERLQSSLGTHSPSCWPAWEAARPCIRSGLGNLSLPLSPEPHGRECQAEGRLETAILGAEFSRLKHWAERGACSGHSKHEGPRVKAGPKTGTEEAAATDVDLPCRGRGVECRGHRNSNTCTVSQSQGSTSLSFPSSMALEGPFSRWPGDEMGVRQGTAPVHLEHSGLHELSTFCVPGVDIKDNRSQHQ